MKIIAVIALILHVISVMVLLFIGLYELSEAIAEEEDIELIEFKSELESMNVGDTKEFPASPYMAKMTIALQVGIELGRTYETETERRVLRRVLIIKRTR